ncbi:MAG: DNA polymerase III subunit alpha, partial [Clostridia bacterium]|nr:DNA polymerase III subunit alpha [Clostridia bacterium]
ELGVINKCGFNDYFLIVWDYCNAAKQMGIPVGPGRGSGVGSLVAYAIGITDVDPLRYSLLFERFLSEERVSMPDFDVDFCFVRRPEVMQYVEKKYGAENVSKIIAYSTMSAKAVVKDVARAYGIEYNEANNWVKNIPVGHCLLKQVLTEGSSAYSADFKKLYDENATAKEIIDVAMQLEGMPRQTSEHAAGVVICSEPLLDHVPMSRNKDDIVTQFDKLVVEHIGLLKMDFLGLKTLTDIDEAIKYIKEDKGIDIDFHKIGYEDPKVYELMSSGDCVAVFQLESGGMTKFMTQLQPTNIEDVIAGISMYRPGPMQFIDDFLRGKRNPSSVVYAHPILKELLEVTYGCIVYQEQVMQIAQKVAGYSFGGADIMRRAISKKKLSVLKEQKETFLHGG